MSRRAEVREFLVSESLPDANAENCDRIAIIDHGRIVAMDTPARLKDRPTLDDVFLELTGREIRDAGERAAVGAQR